MPRASLKCRTSSSILLNAASSTRPSIRKPEKYVYIVFILYFSTLKKVIFLEDLFTGIGMINRQM